VSGAPSTTGSRSGSTRALGAAIAEILTPVAVAAGFDVEEVEVLPAGRRRVVRVTVDRDGGLDLDAVAEISRAFDTALDAGDVDQLLGRTAYTLEVTSPGVERPLTELRHWRRAVGRLVEAPLRAGGTADGRLLATEGSTVTIETTAGARTFSFEELGRGRVVVEFNRPDPPARAEGEPQ
jgi:ribosome maturation factor RimP